LVPRCAFTSPRMANRLMASITFSAKFFGPKGDASWNQQRLAGKVSNFHPHELDIRNRNEILETLRGLRPDAVVHTAAQPSLDLAASIPFPTLISTPWAH
jgi:nucleoside-diphosphate-sugar epimerase